MPNQDTSIMVEIDLGQQPEKKEEKAPEPPKKKLKNLIHRLSLTMFSIAIAIYTNFKSRFVTMADEERVHPAPEGPSDGPEEGSDKPKKKDGRLRLIIKIVVVVLLVVGLANFILWVVINPRKMKFYVTDAALEEFSLSDDNTLHYNLRLNFTVRNPNKRIGFHYESIVDGAHYNGEKFDSGNLLPFRQSPKTTTGLSTWFLGAKRLSVDSDAVNEYNLQKIYGVYPLDVKIRVYTSIKLGKIHMGDFKVKVKCGLKVPLLVGNADGTQFNGFKATQCHVNFNPLVVIYSD